MAEHGLGQIFVELLVNSGQFISGFADAGLATKRFQREFHDAFSTLGGVAATALAPLGEFGAVVGNTLNQIGNYGAIAARSMSGLGGSLGGVAVLGGLAAGGLAAITAGSLSLAAHTAESIAKMGELAQSTGLSVGALSSLGFAGKVVGIDIDTMAKGLEKMDKAVFKAATSTLGSVNAFTRLHIAVRDSSGAIRPTEEIFGDLAAVFANMPDGVIKTALAMEIFGKGGAVMIPLLNKGKEGLQGFLDTAKALGIVLDESTAAGAEKFKEDVATLEAAGEGLAIRLTTDLLPALDFLAEKLVTSFKTGQAQALIDKIAELVKSVLVLGYELAHIGDLKFMGNALAVLDELKGAAAESGVRTHRALFAGGIFADSDDPARLAAEKKDTEEIAKIREETAKRVKADLGGIDWEQFQKNTAAFKSGLEGTLPFPAKFGDFSFTHLPVRSVTGGEGADTRKERDSIVERVQTRIDNLVKEAHAWDDVARAGTSSERLIAEATKAGSDEIAKQLEIAAKGKTGTAEAATKRVHDNETLTRFQAAKKVYDAAIVSLNKDLDKQIDVFTQDEQASLALAAAYQKGGDAIAGAEFDKAFADEAAKAGVLVNVLGYLSPELKKLEDHKKAILGLDLQVQLDKESNTLRTLGPLVDNVNAAYLESAAAVRKNTIELELQKFVLDELAKKVVVTPEQKEQKRASLTTESDRQHAADVLRQADQLDLALLYKREQESVRELTRELENRGVSTLLLDAQMFDFENRLIQQWDEAAFKVGTFSQKLHAVFNELVIQGRNAGSAIAHAFLSAIDGIETQFAKLLTGQKTNFKQIFQDLAESIVKAKIQEGVGKIAEHFGLNIPGLGPKPDGSASRPFHVVMASAAGLAGAAGESGGKGGILGKIFGAIFGAGSPAGVSGGIAPDGTASNPFYVLDAAQASQTGLGGGLLSHLFGGDSDNSDSGGDSGGGGGFWSSVMSGIGAAFGGGGASGIDMMPGKWYVTGENGPELIGPKNGGNTVHPLGNGSQKSGVVQNISFNGFKETDLFRRSGSQMAQMLHRQTSLAMARS